MNYLFFVLAIFFLAIAHYIKIIRQSQFIEIYEKPQKSILTKALSITFILNLILPFKLGNIVRIIYPGNKMKNGKSFSFATILIDLLLDFFTIMLVYGLLLLIDKDVKSIFTTYLIICVFIIILAILMTLFKKIIKKGILHCTSIFNEKIQLTILKTVWYSITSFKDMFKRVGKLPLFINTILSISCYILSYYFLSIFFRGIGVSLSFNNIFNMLYATPNLFKPSLLVFYNYAGMFGLIYLLIYISIPIIIIYLSSYIYSIHPKEEKNKKYIELFPHINPRDRLIFLDEYFSAEKGKYLENYLKINRDVAILQDYSAGSNATTMLCSKENKTFYRKYSIGKDAKKLYEQVEWIKSHKSKLLLTDITSVYYENEVCCYDMPYVSNAVTCFNFVHTMPFDTSWEIIKTVMDDLDSNLHSINRRKMDSSLLELYIEKKVLDNLEIIENGDYIKPLLKYDSIYINGKKYNNLNYYKKHYLNKKYLMDVFKNDEYSDIHGDFTIENIVCLKDTTKKKKKYYIIDPNTGNLHDSPYLDYAKLFQSIHGGYEFLMNTKSVKNYNNQINFLYTKSNIYYKLFEKVVEHLEEKFGKEALKSIFYHEIIHWLRLLPYKINKLGENSLLFYAGFIMVMDDVEKRFSK